MRRLRVGLVVVAGLVAGVLASVAGNAAPAGAGSAARGTSAVLSGANEVGGGDPDGSGSGVVWLDVTANEVCFDLEVEDIGTPTMAHIHEGAAGTNGPVVVDFAIGTNGLDGCVTPSAGTTAQEILDGLEGFYVNVHTADFSGGAIRGQLGLAPTTTEDGSGQASGELSLRDAFDTAGSAPGPDTIDLTLQAGRTFNLTVCPETDEDDLNEVGDLDHVEHADLTIAGAGATVRQTCEGSRVLEHRGNATSRLTLTDLVVTGGDLEAFVGAGDGGGVRAARVLLQHVSIHGNSASDDGGAVWATFLTVEDSYLGRNYARTQGGGAFGDDTLTATRSTFHQNSADHGGGLMGGDITVAHSTFSGNYGNVSGSQLQAPAGSVYASAFEDQRGVGACAFGDVDSLGHNLMQSTSAIDCGFNQPTDSIGTADLGLRAVFPGSLGVGAALYPEPGSPLVDDVPLGGACTTFAGAGCDVGAVELATCTGVFTDVSASHPFCDEIAWMGQTGVSTGSQPGPQYKPNPAVSRAAMSAFMYRLAGEPAFDPPTTATFPDVSTSHPFFLEIEWMAAEEITTGFGDGTYQPSAPVSRGAMSAFMYRLAGEPAFSPPAEPSFSDVGTTHPFFDEIEWMAAEEITTGFGDGTYKPGAAVSRQAMAAFMYRLADGLLPGQILAG